MVLIIHKINTVKNIYTLSNNQYRYSAKTVSNTWYSAKFGTRFSPIENLLSSIACPPLQTWWVGNDKSSDVEVLSFGFSGVTVEEQPSTSSMQQGFPNCGPQTPGGPWGSDRGSAVNYCFFVEFTEKNCVNFLIQSLLKIWS